ncbi:hypothetical protein DKX38_017169 [Salix brachista]|uniref:Uncharacterized protein n=1 Tax=Salix brachista TaxID=2182728 RepID=A0A5N5KUG3_9ROSI|nr:hypothetical protein DKX38_017169 [Salix brachista]
MEPNFSDFQKLKNDKLNVGCENDSFIRDFKGIFIVSAAISAICFLLSLIRLLRNSRPHQEPDEDLLSPGGKSGFRTPEKFDYGEKTRVLRRASTFAQALDKDEMGSPKWEYASNSDNFESLDLNAINSTT